MSAAITGRWQSFSPPLTSVVTRNWSPAPSQSDAVMMGEATHRKPCSWKKRWVACDRALRTRETCREERRGGRWSGRWAGGWMGIRQEIGRETRLFLITREGIQDHLRSPLSMDGQTTLLPITGLACMGIWQRNTSNAEKSHKLFFYCLGLRCGLH